MAESKPVQKAARKSATSTATGKAFNGFSDEERVAIRERAKELKAAGRRNRHAEKRDGESAVLARIAAMPLPFRAMGERLHALILRSAPVLQPATWYGMPGYTKDGKAVCFFRADKKYMTFGFTQEANLAPEEGAPHRLIESGWFFAALDEATEARLSDLVRRVAGGTNP